MSEDVIKKGSVVTFHYTLTIPTEDHVADTTRDAEPATATMGSDELITGLETRLMGLKVGDVRQFEIPCLEAYGPSDMDRILNIPLSEFPDDLDTEPGNVIGFTTPSGEEVAGVILKHEDGDAVVDFSHPLAGYDLLFDVEIIKVQ